MPRRKEQECQLRYHILVLFLASLCFCKSHHSKAAHDFVHSNYVCTKGKTNSINIEDDKLKIRAGSILED